MTMRMPPFVRAERFLEAAKAEFEDAGSDPVKLAQAAEKTWGAYREAAKGLLHRKGEPVPRGTKALEKALKQLGDRDGRVDPMVDRFQAAMKTLHIECFGDGECEVSDIRRDLKRAGAFLEKARTV